MHGADTVPQNTLDKIGMNYKIVGPFNCVELKVFSGMRKKNKRITSQSANRKIRTLSAVKL